MTIATYAYVDSGTGDLFTGTVLPDDVTHWWEMPPGVSINDVCIDLDGELALLPPKPDHDWMIFDVTQGAWVDPRSEEQKRSELLKYRRFGIGRVNGVAGEVRKRFLTDIPGQEALYLMKEAEARAWVADPTPTAEEYPLITAEIGITGATGDEVAQIYLNLSAIWRVAASQLETARLGAIAQIESAPDETVVDTVFNSFAQAIANFGQA